jgi:hypothetical protein
MVYEAEKGGEKAKVEGPAIGWLSGAEDIWEPGTCW